MTLFIINFALFIIFLQGFLASIIFFPFPSLISLFIQLFLLPFVQLLFISHRFGLACYFFLFLSQLSFLSLMVSWGKILCILLLESSYRCEVGSCDQILDLKFLQLSSCRIAFLFIQLLVQCRGLLLFWDSVDSGILFLF